MRGVAMTANPPLTQQIASSPWRLSDSTLDAITKEFGGGNADVLVSQFESEIRAWRYLGKGSDPFGAPTAASPVDGQNLVERVRSARRRLSDERFESLFGEFSCGLGPENYARFFRAVRASEICFVSAVTPREPPADPDEHLVRLWARERVEDCRTMCGRVRVSDDDEGAARACASYAEKSGIKQVPISGATKFSGALRRYLDQDWWLARGRRIAARKSEENARAAGHVHGHATVYCSDKTFERYRASRQRQREWANLYQLINECGDVIDLASAIASSTSNPKIRRLELMLRLRGVEEYATERGMKGLFVNVTTPSRMHTYNANGHANPRFDGTTARQANDYLNNLWRRARAKFKRLGIRFMGARVVEPHHDGTPHWHMLIFAPPDRLGEVGEIMTSLALEDSPDEPGASEVRCVIMAIDLEKGDGAGYLAKYVAKGIDGAHLDESYATGEGGEIVTKGDAPTAADRAVAWARCHGIHQFEFFGTAPVGLYRELRRLRSPVQPSLIEQARLAADRGSWREYEAVQRLEIGFTLSAVFECSGTHRYDDVPVHRVVGIAEPSGEFVTSRHHTWSIVATDYQPSTPWTCGNNCTPADASPMPTARVTGGLGAKPPDGTLH